MTNIPLSYFSIALDALGLIVVLIIFASCLGERIRKQGGSVYFCLLLIFTMITLAADIVGWVGEGRPAFATMTLIANTVATCTCYVAIFCFLGYLKESLYANSKAVSVTVTLLGVLCLMSVVVTVFNIPYRFAYTVDPQGHYVATSQLLIWLLYRPYPLLSFFSVILMSLFARRTARVNRFAFIVYTLCPIAGVIADLLIHGLSVTYIGFVIGVLMIYTSIYLQKQRLINAQRNALMLSQINPHFMYNTLSAIAAMCDIAPERAKALTLDFSQFLRQNLDTLTCEELIPFKQEMRHVGCYLKIEKARFREKLNIVYSIRCKDFYVPPLSIQPLVENAVRHGVTRKAGGGTVRIDTHCTETHYVIEVIDDGVGFDTEAGRPADGRSHVGFENVRDRVGSMCRGEVTVKSIVGVGTRVTIKIPRKKERK